jgi:hypothetical protein
VSRCFIVPAGSDIPRVLARQLTSETEGCDFSSIGVVFPHDRPRLYLNRALAEAAGGPIFPPTFLTVDRFMLRLAAGEASPGFLDPLDALALVLDALQGTASGPLAPLARDPGLSWFWAQKLLDAVEELDAERISDEALDSVRLGTEEGSQVARDLLSGLAGLRRSFHRAVEEAGALTRGMAYARASRAVEEAGLEEHESVWIVLPAGLTKSEIRVFDRLSRLEHVRFIAEESVGEGLSLEGEPLAPEAPMGEPEVRLWAGFDAHSEIVGLQNVIEEQGDLEGTVIVLPKPESLVPVLEEVLSTVEAPYNISLGYPFKRTPVHALIRTILQVGRSSTEEGPAARDYLDLLLHPYVKNLSDGIPPEACRVLVHALETRITEGRMPSVRLDGLEGDREFFDRVGQDLPDPVPGEALQAALARLHDVYIRSLGRASTLGEAARVLGDALRYLLEHSPASGYPFSGEFFGAAMDFFSAIEGSRLSGLRPAERSFLLDLLEELAAAQRIPFHGRPLGGVQVLGFLETRALRFKHVHILDVNEEVLPALAVEDPLLPQGIRRILGLPGPKEREAVHARHFRRLLAGAEKVHLYHIQSEKTIPSRFIARWKWGEEKASGRVGVRPATALSFEIRPSAEPGIVVKKSSAIMDVLGGLSWSASALDTYLRCPMRFYFTRVLNLKEREGLGDAFEPAGVGILLHEALERLYRPLLGTRIDADGHRALMSRIPEALDAARTSAGWEDRGEPALILDLMKFRVERFLESETRWSAVQPLHLELPLEGTFDGRRVQGKLDRLDLLETEDGSVHRILDYKSGTAEGCIGPRKAALMKAAPSGRKETLEVIGSFQMPLYAWLARTALGWTYSGMQVVTQPLKKQDEAKVLFPPKPDPETFMETLALPAMANIIRELLDPEVPFSADPDREGLCNSCPCSLFCSRG